MARPLEANHELHVQGNSADKGRGFGPVPLQIRVVIGYGK